MENKNIASKVRQIAAVGVVGIGSVLSVNPAFAQEQLKFSLRFEGSWNGTVNECADYLSETIKMAHFLKNQYPYAEIEITSNYAGINKECNIHYVIPKQK